MGSFDPKKHLIQLKGKWYLETKWRLMWMRDEHPDWRVGTEIVSLDPPLVKAAVYDADGATVATGHGGANDKGNAVWSGRAVEKAETAALGRALAHAGYGTQWLESDANHLADSPVEPRANGNRDKRSDAQRLGNGGDRRVTTTTNEAPANVTDLDDLRNRDVASLFIQRWRSQALSDGEVLAALGVSRLSEWTQGRAAADAAVNEWLAGNVAPDAEPDLNRVYHDTALYWNARKHFDNWLGQQFPDGVRGLSDDELIAAIEADRHAQGKERAAMAAASSAAN